MGSSEAQQTHIASCRAVQMKTLGVRVPRRYATDSAGICRSIGMHADRYALIRSSIRTFVSCDQGNSVPVYPEHSVRGVAYEFDE
jgi:hypothetical protein